ncbi:hypothetical protein [Kutzneria sp. 744]|uniref:hypothetical protein n=1 Tax=Kutzneria sp. (strain 744) TaxID=345341 RepID=UPI0012F7EAC4|nr:hypothetical protein [Kutzneria sp. 744]
MNLDEGTFLGRSVIGLVTIPARRVGGNEHASLWPDGGWVVAPDVPRCGVGLASHEEAVWSGAAPAIVALWTSYMSKGFLLIGAGQ